MRTFAEKDAGLQAVLLFGPSSITQGTAATIWIGQPKWYRRLQTEENCRTSSQQSDGIGDDAHGWAADGVRNKVFHDGGHLGAAPSL